jgi:hypothetical protein
MARRDAVFEDAHVGIEAGHAAGDEGRRGRYDSPAGGIAGS